MLFVLSESQTVTPRLDKFAAETLPEVVIEVEPPIVPPETFEPSIVGMSLT